jgi:hypothetical protein
LANAGTLASRIAAGKQKLQCGEAELQAFEQLIQLRQQTPGKLEVTVTGPLRKFPSEFVLKVREYKETVLPAKITRSGPDPNRES